MITKNLSLVVCTILLVSFAMMILGTSYSVAIPADNGKISLQKNVGQYKAYSHKIDARILDQIGKSNLKKSGPFNINIDQSGKFWVYLNLDSNKTVPSKTIDVTGKDNNVLVTKLTLDEINQISKSNNVKSITLPDMAVFPTVVSEGVAFSHADLMQQSGYAGNGTVVAVIDDSFFTNDPEIKNNIMSSTLFDSTNLCSSSISCGKASGHSHGTAVAQTVVDMAPGVKLRLYVIGNSVDFNNAIDDAIAHHVNIITTSVVFPGLGGNGAGGFRDGTSTVAQKVNQAVASGIFVVTSAGNEGNGHWQGVYKISPITPSQIGLLSWQSVMDFRPTAAGVQRACLPVTDNGYPFIATWNAWPTTSQDYDFFLYDSTMTSVLAISEGDQLDFPSAPIEGFNGVGGNGKACLVVASFSSTQNHSFHIYGSNGANPFDKSVNSRFGSIETPADANGSFTAGAVYYANNSLENFSSSGPTDDARLKPEIC